MYIQLAQINSVVGDIDYNSHKILAKVAAAKQKKVDLLIFPELALCGYPPQDLLFYDHFFGQIERAKRLIAKECQGITVILGLPRLKSAKIYNCAAIISNGKSTYQAKTLLPNYDLFNEKRYFTPAENYRSHIICGVKTCITICEDIWADNLLKGQGAYEVDMKSRLQQNLPELIINISASPYAMAKPAVRAQIAQKLSADYNCPVVLCNVCGANDGIIFDGQSFAVDPAGNFVSAAAFKEDDLYFNLPGKQIKPETKSPSVRLTQIAEVEAALILGVKDYFHKMGFKKAILGLSGGIDSAVVACIAKKALGAENVTAITMPSKYTSEESLRDAKELASRLGIQIKNISINGLQAAFLDSLADEFKGLPEDITEENLQARVRAVILMAYSNKKGALLLNTSNKSEAAVGYTTLYGDMCGALAVIGDLLKTEVYALARHINSIDNSIPAYTIDREPTAELADGQKDSDTLPNYEILDQILKLYIEERLSSQEIARQLKMPLPEVEKICRLVNRNEYKRRQGPPCIKVSGQAFNLDRVFPVVQRFV